jgi:hypothetical protein
MQGHLAAHPGQPLHQKVGRSHAHLIPAGVKADSLTGFQTGKHLTMSIGLRDWVNA